MKCPKCGFTSFDYLDECRKCGIDISDVRARLGIIAVSPDERAAVSPTGMAADEPAGMANEQAEQDGMGGATFLGDSLSEETFEDSFDSMVDKSGVPDSGASAAEEQGIVLDSPLPGPETTPAPEGAAEGEGDEEFLDLDFGGIFEEDEK